MDTFSHAAWGYAALYRQPRLRWWGALAGAAPDLLWFIPSTIERVIDRGWGSLTVGSDRGIWRADGPPLPPELVESYFRYYIYTHSLVLLAAVVAILLVTRWRGYAWLAVPYALHIVMDIPTHERYQTRPFYPLSSWQYQGLSWADPRIFWPNVVALILVYAWILVLGAPGARMIFTGRRITHGTRISRIAQTHLAGRGWSRSWNGRRPRRRRGSGGCSSRSARHRGRRAC